jgi:DNA-binding transcriptional LysR family regulator
MNIGIFRNFEVSTLINELKLKCFLCLAETLNFTATGKKLYFSQQALSRHIANLEEDMGIRLFTRSRNSVELTEAGEQFYRFFKETGARYHSLLAELADRSTFGTKNIRIGYQNWLDLGPAVGAAMAILREKTPDLHLLGERHSPVALISLLENGTLDMILIHQRFIPASEWLSRLLLIETPMQMVVARSSPLCQEARRNYHVFATLPFLINALEGESHAVTVKRAQAELQPYYFAPKEIVVLPNRDSIYTEAELGRGVFLSSSMTQTSQSETLLRFDTGVTEGLYCVWRGGDAAGYIGQYARQLQLEYGKLSKHYLRTRKWS